MKDIKKFYEELNLFQQQEILKRQQANEEFRKQLEDKKHE
jgi:hypothetical protein